MNEQGAKFDEFALNYKELHDRNISISGESSDFFAKYKIRDLRQITAQAGLRSIRTIIDFGGGIGKSVPYLKEYFPASKLVVMDVSPASLAAAQASFGHDAEYVLFDGQTIPRVEDVDLVFAACVFHHIPEELHIPLLSQLRDSLNPGGMIGIYEHNPWNPLTRRAVDRWSAPARTGPFIFGSRVAVRHGSACVDTRTRSRG